MHKMEIWVLGYYFFLRAILRKWLLGGDSIKKKVHADLKIVIVYSYVLNETKQNKHQLLPISPTPLFSSCPRD